ncbi:MAG: hypothetical protein V1648_00275, partial [Candidatus Aenigmatarchaeota archaeon]
LRFTPTQFYLLNADKSGKLENPFFSLSSKTETLYMDNFVVSEGTPIEGKQDGINYAICVPEYIERGSEHFFPNGLKGFHFPAGKAGHPLVIVEPKITFNGDMLFFEPSEIVQDLSMCYNLWHGPDFKDPVETGVAKELEFFVQRKDGVRPATVNNLHHVDCTLPLYSVLENNPGIGYRPVLEGSVGYFILSEPDKKAQPVLTE